MSKSGYPEPTTNQNKEINSLEKVDDKLEYEHILYGSIVVLLATLTCYLFGLDPIELLIKYY